MTEPTPEPPIVTDWAPTPESVAQILRARVKDANMVEQEMWNENTRPTLAQVEGIIETATGDIVAVLGVGNDIPEQCRDGARGVAMLLAAMLIELSYWPEQVRSDRSPYQAYKDLYDAQIQAVRNCVSLHGDIEEDSSVGRWGNIGIVPEITARYRGLYALWALRAGVRSPFSTLIGPWGDIPPDGPWPEPENPQNWAQPFQPPRQPPLPEDLPIGDLPASGETLAP